VRRRPTATALQLLLAALMALGIAVVVAADDPGSSIGPGRPHARSSFSPADVRLIARRVERLRDLHFLHPVRPRFVTRADAVRVYGESSREDYPARQQAIDEEELKLVGLIRPGVDIGKVVGAIAEEQVLGFYDTRSKRLVVVRDPVSSKPLLEITLAHELVHALEDQRFHFRKRGGLDDDEAIGEEALAEGSATVVMAEYADRFLGGGDLLDVALDASSASDTALPPYVEKLLLFPYEVGESFVETFRGDTGNWRAVDQLYRLRRPRSAEQVLHPERYAIDDKPRHVTVRDVGARLGRGWKRVDSSTLGEFELRMLFEIVGRRDSPAAAKGWGGGRFELWRRQGVSGSCPAPCIARDVAIMRFAWDSERDRAEAERRLPDTFEHGLKGKRAASRAGIGLWLSRGGAVAMTGRGLQTTIVIAPTARTAAALLLARR
jgi:hypothetical protein